MCNVKTSGNFFFLSVWNSMLETYGTIGNSVWYWWNVFMVSIAIGTLYHSEQYGTWWGYNTSLCCMVLRVLVGIVLNFGWTFLNGVMLEKNGTFE